MNKKICCVNDMPGVGKIALAAMIPILSAKYLITFKSWEINKIVRLCKTLSSFKRFKICA